MKTKLLKIIPMACVGLSLTACTILSDLGIGGKADITKMAKYKNEVTLKEFVAKVKSSIKDSEYAKEGFKLGDSKLMAGASLTATQKLTNESFKNKTKNEAELKAEFSADGTYDKDNASILATAKGSYSAKETNAMLGEASYKYSGKYDMAFMPNGAEQYAIADNKNALYFNVPTGAEFDINTVLSLGLNSVMSYANLIPDDFDETPINDMLKQYGITLKFYDDSNVFTVTGTWSHSFGIYTYDEVYNPETYTYEKTNEQDVAKGQLEVNFKAQFKVVKVIKLRVAAEGKATVDYIKDCNANSVMQLIGLTGMAGQCQAGDQEVITAKVEAGVNLEQKDVTNKLPDLAKYDERIISEEETSHIAYNW